MPKPRHAEIAGAGFGGLVAAVALAERGWTVRLHEKTPILRAEGFSLALEKIYAVARGVDAKTMGLQYLEALKALGASPATKIIFPLELTQLLRPFLGGAEDGK